MLRPLGILFGALLFASCAVADAPPLAKAAHVSQEVSAKPRLWYLGLGLYDETWSEGDVSAMAAELATRAPGFRVNSAVLTYGPAHRFPPPDPANVIDRITQIARSAAPGDVVMIYVSTHGAPGELAREADGRDADSADIDEVDAWLAPLGERPTVLVLSACFSGSFIPALRAQNRIIFAAARRDRTSFGCRAGAEHTVFGQALLDALAKPGISLHAVVEQVDADVAAKERGLGIVNHSEPQVFVGTRMSQLYEAPVF